MAGETGLVVGVFISRINDEVLVVAAILVVFALIAWRVLSRVTGEPHPVPQAAHPGAPAQLPADPRTAELAARIRATPASTILRERVLVPGPVKARVVLRALVRGTP